MISAKEITAINNPFDKTPERRLVNKIPEVTEFLFNNTYYY